MNKHRDRTSTDEFKSTVGEASKRHWKTDAYREKQKAHQEKYWDAEKRAAYGLRSAKFLANPHLPPRADNTSNYRGVKKLPSGKFAARAAVKGKHIHIGVYDTAEQAHDAYVEFKNGLKLVGLTGSK